MTNANVSFSLCAWSGGWELLVSQSTHLGTLSVFYLCILTTFAHLHNWMAWCKTELSDFFGQIFFPSKVPEFLHVLFNLEAKHSPVFFGLRCSCSRCCIHCACCSILSSFSQKQIAKQPKKYRGMFYYVNEQHMEKGKKVHLKSHLGQSCTQPFNCSNSNILLLTNQMVTWQPKEPFRAPVCVTTYCALLNLWRTREV